MGNNSSSNRMEREQDFDMVVRGVPAPLDLSGYKKWMAMAETKFLIHLLNFIFVPLFGYTLFVYIDDIKGWILLMVSVSYALVKLFFYVKRQYQAIHKENQEARLRDIDIKRRHQEAKEIELEQLERELSLRVTGLTPNQRRNRDKN